MMSMVKTILFDLFETLITESRTRPLGVSSLASQLGCVREDFRRHWQALRPAVRVGRLSFRQALREIAARLGQPVDDLALEQISDNRVRVKAQALAEIEPDILSTIDSLRSRGIRLGVLSNCFAEDIVAWPHSSLASRVDCAVFSFEVGLAKPNPGIYREAMRRLQADASTTWFIGDGGDDELSGAEEAGLRAFKALWFLRRWPHFREEPAPGSVASLASVGEICSLVERA